MMRIDEEFLRRTGLAGESNDAGFLLRVYADGLEKYRRRLRQIGFDGELGHVLDAGCGFGQWAFALAELGARVTGCDVSQTRVDICRSIAREFGFTGTHFFRAKIENIPLPDGAVDGIFCYSALYYTNIFAAIRMFHRLLKPGGLLYISTNGPGRFFYDIVNNPNSAADFSARRYGLKTMWNTLSGRWDGLSIENGAHFARPGFLKRLLRGRGFDIVGSGAEGSLSVGKISAEARGEPFHPATYLGLPNVYEILARKAPSGAIPVRVRRRPAASSLQVASYLLSNPELQW